ADQRFHAVEVERSRGVWLDPKSALRPFSEIAEEWFAANPEKRSSSRARDRSILDRHVFPTLGPSPVGQVTAKAVQTLVTAWSGKMQPSSARRCYDVVRAVFNYAVDTDVIARSPCRNIKLPTVEQKTRRVVDAEDLARLAVEVGADNAPMLYLGA